MKRCFLLILCVWLATCTGVQAQMPASPPGPPKTDCQGTPACQQAEADMPGRIWVEAESLLWWMRGAAVPPLVTASPAGTLAAQAGVLGQPSTVILFGGNHVNDDARFGGRFALGGWLDECQRFGVEGDFFMLSSTGEGFAASSAGNPILARPFFSVTGQPNSELISFPGLLTGSVSASAASTGLLGADALVRANLCRSCGCCGCGGYEIDAVAGYRYLRLSDHLGVDENLVSTSAASPNLIPPGTNIVVVDHFDTRNEFHGFDLGLKGSWHQGPWVLQGRAQLALGDNRELVNIFGKTTVSVPGVPPPVTSAGGLLALPSNMGRFSRDHFDVIPELGIRAGYQVTRHLQVFAGYTFLYWDDVVRAGNEVDLVVNPTFLPRSPVPPTGPHRPMPLLSETSFWAQGIELGFELRF
jgi:hypothetical protein